MTSLGLLTKQQSILSEKLSQIVLRESTEELSLESDTNELAEKNTLSDLKSTAKQMLTSEDPSDKRFIYIYNIR